MYINNVHTKFILYNQMESKLIPFPSFFSTSCSCSKPLQTSQNLSTISKNTIKKIHEHCSHADALQYLVKHFWPCFILYWYLIFNILLRLAPNIVHSSYIHIYENVKHWKKLIFSITSLPTSFSQLCWVGNG